jgi:hypothetical protein
VQVVGPRRQGRRATSDVDLKRGLECLQWVGAFALDASNAAWVEAVDSFAGTFALKVRAR